MSNGTYEETLKCRIDEVLHYIWDPIGVRGTPEARGEYEAYAVRIFQDVLEGKSKREIANYLGAITTDRMGLGLKKEHDDKVADIILDWARFLKSPYEL